MRRWSVPAAGLALVVGLPLAVMAGTTRGESTPISCMDTVWRTTPASTSSPNWVPVPGLRRTVMSIFPMTIDVSAVVSGAPVEFRIRSTNVGGQTLTSKPGPTRFVPGPRGPNSFAYQWVDRGNAGAAHDIELRLQWRSRSGNLVQMLRGDMSVLYATDVCRGFS